MNNQFYSSIALVLGTMTHIANADDSVAPAPVVKVGLGTGLQYWAEHGPLGPGNGIGGAMRPGMDLGFRASVELRPWLAVEGRAYMAYTSAKSDVAGPVGFLTAGGFVGVRFTVPLQRLQPYLVLGPGVFSTGVVGVGPTPLYGATAPSLCGGFGVQVPISRRLSVGAEYLFHYLIGEKYSDNAAIEGGDPVTLNAFAQIAL